MQRKHLFATALSTSAHQHFKKTLVFFSTVTTTKALQERVAVGTERRRVSQNSSWILSEWQLISRLLTNDFISFIVSRDLCCTRMRANYYRGIWLDSIRIVGVLVFKQRTPPFSRYCHDFENLEISNGRARSFECNLLDEKVNLIKAFVASNENSNSCKDNEAIINSNTFWKQQVYK